MFWKKKGILFASRAKLHHAEVEFCRLCSRMKQYHEIALCILCKFCIVFDVYDMLYVHQAFCPFLWLLLL